MTITVFGSKTCPFVHRIRVLLSHLKLPHEFGEIDLSNKPAWFLELSPKGLVPAIKTENGIGLFESGVIAEYLVDFSGKEQSMIPADRDTKYKCKAWDAMGHNLVGSFHQAMWANQEQQPEKLEKLHRDLSALEAEKASQEQSFFLNDQFGLTDSAYASVFYRMALTKELYGLELLSESKYPKLSEWWDNMKKLPCIIEGHPDFRALWQARVQDKKSWVLQHGKGQQNFFKS